MSGFFSKLKDAFTHK